jgi:hypothetical protein
MSYAAMAAKNAPPEDQLPQPSQDLLDGHFAGETEAVRVVDDSEKVAVVTPEWKEHPVTTTSIGENASAPAATSVEHRPAPTHDEPHVSEVAPTPTPAQAYQPPPGPSAEPPKAKDKERDLPEGSIKVGPDEEQVKRAARKGEAKAKEVEKDVGHKVAQAEEKAEQVGEEVKKEGKRLGKDVKEYAGKAEEGAKSLGKKARAEFNEAETAAARYYAKSKEVLLRPGVLGGLLGVANVGIISALSYAAYQRREFAWDRRIVAASVAGTLALFGAEGVLAERYLDTPEGRAEAERARQEGSRVWLHTKETVLRPGVAGGLVGAVNVAVLGAVGYFSYKNWNLPRWDRQTVSSVVVGLIALSAAEGYVGKQYKDKELPRQKRKGNAGDNQ